MPLPAGARTGNENDAGAACAGAVAGRSALVQARLRDALVSFADLVLQRARVSEGLFVDALRASDAAWLPYDVADVASGRVLANGAYQQTWTRFLSGLSALTGDSRYRCEAERVTQACFRHTDANGLIFWGGHVAFDVEAGRPIAPSSNGWTHELKHHYPFYELMWAVDPDATRRYVEAFWNAHVLDWSTLDFNRHGRYDARRGPLWSSEYRGGPVHFWGVGLTFVNTGSDLYYAAGMLASLTADAGALSWAKRLARRYVETREPDIGLSAYQFSQSPTAFCDGPKVRGDRAQYQIAELVGTGHVALESTLFRPRPIVQRAQLRLSEALREHGAEFGAWAADELRAWMDVAYRPSDNTFAPMLTDGLSLEGLPLTKGGYFGSAGRRFCAIPAGPDFFWTYAQAYRVTGDDRFADAAIGMARHNGLGDVESRAPAPPAGAPASRDFRDIFGLLELYRATGRAALLDTAVAVAEAILDHDRVGPLFVSGAAALVGDPRPLALLHLLATLQDRPDAVPPFVGLLGLGMSGW